MSTPTTSLSLRKILACPPDYAFHAWTEPKLFQQWLGCGSGGNTTATMDLRVGGKYRIGFSKPGEKKRLYVGGEFLTIKRPELLEYTWIWENETKPDWRDRTIVRVEFKPLENDRTEILLTHDRFTDDAERRAHLEGWTKIVDEMVRVIEAQT